MVYVVNNNIVTFCNTFKIVHTFPPYFIKIHHIIHYKPKNSYTCRLLLGRRPMRMPFKS